MAQPDFRARPVDPSLLQAYIKSRSRDQMGNVIAGASKGFQTGLGIVQSLDEMREKKKTAQTISDFLEKDEVTGELKNKQFAEFNEQHAGLPELYIKTGNMSLLNNMMTTQTRQEGKRDPVEVAADKKAQEQASKAMKSVGRLAVINKQFNEALPSKGKSPTAQRLSGFFSQLGATTGLKKNPKLMGLTKNIRPIAIQMIRSFGEVGNLSESEQQGAIKVVNQAGLTEEERYASTAQFIEFALSGADERVKKYIRKDKKTMDMLDFFGVNLDIAFGEPDISGEVDFDAIFDDVTGGQ